MHCQISDTCIWTRTLKVAEGILKTGIAVQESGCPTPNYTWVSPHGPKRPSPIDYGFIEMVFSELLLAFDWRNLHNVSPPLWAKAGDLQAAAPLVSMTVPAQQLDVVSSPGAAVAQLPLCAPDRPDPGSDRLGLWGEAESRRCFDPAALLYVVYLQVLAPAQRKEKGKKQGCLLLPFPDRNQKLTTLGAQNTSARPRGPCGAAKN